METHSDPTAKDGGFELGLPLFVLIYASTNGISWLISLRIAIIQWASIVGVFGELMGEPLALRLL